MRKIVLNVPRELHEALQLRRQESGVPTSVFIRRTLAEVLKVKPRESELLPRVEEA
jgi:hypothetical protein